MGTLETLYNAYVGGPHTHDGTTSCGGERCRKFMYGMGSFVVGLENYQRVDSGNGNTAFFEIKPGDASPRYRQRKSVSELFCAAGTTKAVDYKRKATAGDVLGGSYDEFAFERAADHGWVLDPTRKLPAAPAPLDIGAWERLDDGDEAPCE